MRHPHNRNRLSLHRSVRQDRRRNTSDSARGRYLDHRRSEPLDDRSRPIRFDLPAPHACRLRWRTGTRGGEKNRMTFFRQSLTIAAKDLRSEFRTKETLNATISFSIVILLLFSFAFEPTEEEARVLSGGLLWLVFAFAGVLILNRGFARALPNDCLDALIASPISGPALFFGKTIANFTLLLAVEFICVPVFGIFYDVPWTLQFWPIVTVTVLASWGLCVVGTAFSAMTVNLRLRELM